MATSRQTRSLRDEPESKQNSFVGQIPVRPRAQGNIDRSVGSSQSKQALDPRSFGFSKDRTMSSDLPEHRPGLPPRREHQSEQSHSTAVIHLGPRADSDRNAPRAGESRSLPRSSARRPLPKESLSPTSHFLPPPKRIASSAKHGTIESEHVSHSQRFDFSEQTTDRNTIKSSTQREHDTRSFSTTSFDYPDSTNSNRRPPYFKHGVKEIIIGYDTRLFDIHNEHVCASGHLTKAWNLASGEVALRLGPGEKEVRVTAVAFKPQNQTEHSATQIWLGTNVGELQEVDVSLQRVTNAKPNAHSPREILKIHRHRQCMWTLDDDGRLQVWQPDDTGVPSLDQSPLVHRVPRGHTFSIVIENKLWLALGKEIRIVQPEVENETAFFVSHQPLGQSGAGEVTSGAVLSTQPDRVYFGHTDGKVTIYSTAVPFACLGIVNVSVYKIISLAGVGLYLWAGYNTGMIYVYDTNAQPWIVKKDWHAHANSVFGIVVDRSSLELSGLLCIASIGTDNAVRFWDGMLEDDWLGTYYVAQFHRK